MQTFVVEELERRRHLSATLLSAYYPLVAGARWVYNTVVDRHAVTDTEAISSKTVTIGSQTVFQRISTRTHSDGARTIDLENLSPSGQIQFFSTGDSNQKFSFDTPILFPRLAQIGRRQRTSGTVDVQINAVHLPGTFNSDIRIVGKGRTTVPAGTFSTLKISFKLILSVHQHQPGGPDIDITINNTRTEWRAKNVGVVQKTTTSRGQSTVNGGTTSDSSTASGKLRRYTIPR